ncbi:hypothetical protein Goklo_017454 [Gossypium klotzschianum]|uniref:Uncharacterized protein n=1 Tax=Gossypium klotzschianum TaxID=34286 RepID=A0A7J8UHJ8_9ROSI|nr:hypothetical protein [Gossypium klotzschianum]
MSNAWNLTRRMKRLAVGPMTTSEHIEWWGRRINDNILEPSQGDSQLTGKNLRVIPSELEIIRQDFERRNLELEKKIEQMEEDKMNLRLDMDAGSGSNPGDNPTNPVIPDFDEMAEKEKANAELPKPLEDRCRWLEEKFKVMESADSHHGIDAKDLSLVPDLALPYKFNILEFEKYNGTSCPEAHITMFCRRMAGYVNNDQLVIHYF